MEGLRRGTTRRDDKGKQEGVQAPENAARIAMKEIIRAASHDNGLEKTKLEAENRPVTQTGWGEIPIGVIGLGA